MTWMTIAWAVLVLFVVRRLLVTWQEEHAPKTCWVYADRTPFVGMNTGTPGYTRRLCIGEKLTLRQARRRARYWAFKHPHGEAIIYTSGNGEAPTDIHRHLWTDP